MHAHCSCVQYQRTNPLPSANGYEHIDAIAQINPPSYGRFVFHSGSSTQLQRHPSSVHVMQHTTQHSTTQQKQPHAHILTRTHTCITMSISKRYQCQMAVSCICQTFSTRHWRALVYWCIGCLVVAVRRSCCYYYCSWLELHQQWNRIMYTSLYYNYTFYGSMYTFMYSSMAWHGMAWYTIRIFSCPLFCLLKSFLCWFRHCLPLYEIVYVYTANTDLR